MRRLPRTRVLAAVAVVGSLALAGCTGSSEPKAGAGPTLLPSAHPKPTTESVAPIPTPVVLPDQPLKHPRYLPGDKRPNLLMITTDDAAVTDLKFMPRVQQLLVKQGVTFADAYSPTPVCVPARASLLTGQYAHNHGALTISGQGGGFRSFPDQDTLPVALQKAGYDTLFVGKYLNGYGEHHTRTYIPPGWTSWQATVDPTTYNFVHPMVNDNGKVKRHYEYSTDLLSRLSNEQLADPAREKKPWYLWVNYVAPHKGGPPDPDDPEIVYPDAKDPVPTTRPADEDRNTFEGLAQPDDPDMFEADTSDKPKASPAHATWDAVHRSMLTEAYQQRLEALQSVDRAVAKTLDTLKRTGQLDNTLIVFASDNGYSLGSHNVLGKLWQYHRILTIPVVMRGPGLPKGKTSKIPIANPDIATTLAAAAGAKIGRPQDGVDVLPWIGSGATTRVVPIEGYPIGGGLVPLYRGVTTGRYTYVLYRHGGQELYDHRSDPYELTNVAKDPKYREARKELRNLTERYASCAGSTCPKDFYP